MGAEFLTPRDAIAAGVPKSTAHRIKDTLAGAVHGQILVVDGTAVTSPGSILELLNGYVERASDAEGKLQSVQERADRLDQDLQLARHELDVQRARTASFVPRLAAVSAQVAQLLDENLNTPESGLSA